MRLLAQICQEFTLQFNRIDQCALLILGRMGCQALALRERVFAPGFGVAPHQGFGVGIQKHGFDHYA